MKNQGLYNLVFLRHREDESGRNYLFQCPLHIKLKKGDDVSCDTKYGGKSGICSTNSFLMEDETAEQIAGMVGGAFPPKMITGIAIYETRKIYVPFE